MKRMKRIVVIFAAACMTCAPFARSDEKVGAAAAQAAGAQVAADGKPHIDVVFCLDCSGSMQPVIDTAKAKIWSIVNELAKAKPAPILRIGLLGYGDGDRRYFKFDLSDDLDGIYKNLMTFRADIGGDEFVGRAVNKAVHEFRWTEGKGAFKVVYVIGNETARQGPAEFDYSKTAPDAIRNDVMVNAIYAGGQQYPDGPPTWREMAKLADGQYMEIAGDGGAMVIQTPYDKDLGALNGKLNDTYVAYGARGKDAKMNQAAQDTNAAAQAPGGAVLAERAASKSGHFYRNSGWDVVDAARDKTIDLEKMKADDLPDEMKGLKPQERRAYVEQKSKEREGVQKQIQELSAKREVFVKEEIKKQGAAGNSAFDEAIRKTIQSEAAQKGYQFEEKK